MIRKIITEVSGEYFSGFPGVFMEFIYGFDKSLIFPEDAVNIFLLNFVGSPRMVALRAESPSPDRTVVFVDLAGIIDFRDFAFTLRAVHRLCMNLSLS